MHYSGHGTQIPDDDGDEADGMDEALCPVDYQTEGMIRDDDIYRELVATLPAGCRLTVLMDCCHSGTILDLPYSFTASAQGIENFQSGADTTLSRVTGDMK
jgi:metacaspase-1